MGYLESAVVIYIRELYYPEGFEFPLKIISYKIAITELLREIATLIMLLSIAIITGKKPVEKFAYFIFSFAVWDIFYYVFLKAIIGWPASFFTWDILFLIPFTWVGPVIAPIINSLTMIILAFSIIYFIGKNENAKINVLQWSFLISGSVIIIYAYTEEYLHFMLRYFSFAGLFDFTESKNVLARACQFIPQYFNWFIFFTGEIFHLTAIILFFLKNQKFKNASI